MKTFRTDHYFQIGALHYALGKPNQDYAMSGSNSREACAIVSDGCSSGRHTDVGSRIQAWALLESIRRSARIATGSLIELATNIRTEKNNILENAEKLLGLIPADMLATSLYAYLSQIGGIVRIEGDGLVARKYRDGKVVLTLYEWKDNTPFYPAYAGDALNQFIEVHGGDLSAPRLIRKTVTVHSNGVREPMLEEFALEEGILGITEEISEDELEDLQFLAVSSDGVAQIEGVDWVDAALGFLSFKSMNGEFAKRRTIRALKDYERKGIKAADDVSIAVIRIEIEEDNDAEDA